MHRNVGGTDRVVRGLGGVVLLVLAVVALASGRTVLGTVVGVASVGLLFTWATGFCVWNALFGTDTTNGARERADRESPAGDDSAP